MAAIINSLILVFGLYTGSVGGMTCPNYWFGPSCNFQCHCLDRRCDVITGDCLGGRGCDMGYFGPACQYFSVAFNQRTFQTNPENGRDSSLAVDGYETTCSTTKNLPFQTWRVNFTYNTWLVWADILFLERVDQDIIDMYGLNGDETYNCNATKTWIGFKLLRITCKDAYNATSMAILSKTSDPMRLQLCEVQVYGGRNLAMNMTTTQSSEYINPKYPSSLAVDGNNSTNFNDDSCTHTSDTGDNCTGSRGTKDPWWRVNLNNNYLIYRVKVFNQRGQNINRLEDFRLKLGIGRTGPYSPLHRDRAKPVKEVTSVLMPANQTAYRLEVRLRGQCRILTLCEVQVFGDCLDGRYGLSCEFSCSCRNPTEVCNKIDGRCVSGCADGITGIDCKRVCSRRNYGRNCASTCSTNCVDGLCNNVNGSCNCIPGWKGHNCTRPCDPGTYGPDCRERCNNCRDESCLPVNGMCIIGCGRGRIGSQCREECNQTTFGWNCNETCSDSCVGQRCDGVTGACIECPDGLEGSLCEREKGASVVVPIVVAVIVILLIALAVIAIIVYLRHRRRKGPRPDVVPLKDVMSYDSGNDKVRVYENVAVPEYQPDNDSDATEDLNDHVDITMDTDLDDNNMTLDRAKLTIDDTMRKSDQLNEVEENICVTEDSHILDVTDLPSHMTVWRENGDYLLQEFKSLPRDLQEDVPHIVGLREENRKKNRYKNICAYDHSRVKLNLKAGDPNSDYINANYVKGYTKSEVFIASQGPTKKMIGDFIRMLWEKKVPIVVMLTNVVEEGKRKCEQYWDDGDEMDTGDLTIDVIDCEEYAHYTVRTLQLSESLDPDSTRRVKQYHFTAWPDKSVPQSPWSLIDFRNKVMASQRKKGPIVVHCSAGVGRTGTFIGLDYLMRMADEVGHVDIYDCVERMRRARVNMVQTLDQYIFLHEIMTLSILLPPVIDSNVFLTDHVLDDASLTSEFMKLSTFVGQDAVMLDVRSLKKSESMLSLADEAASLASLPGEGLDYDGAVFLPSYRHYKEYLLMDTPDETTAEEFYQWMFDLDIRVLVTLDHPNPNIWPEEGKTLNFSKGRITCSGVKKDGVTVVRNLVYTEQGLDLVFSQLMCPDWVDSTNLCDTPQVLLDFIRTVSQTTCQRPVVVQSSPSFGNGGIFCCLAGILQTLEAEKKVAVPHIVSQVRARKPGVIRSLVEYKLCYDCVERHLGTEHIYTNFNPTSKT